MAGKLEGAGEVGRDCGLMGGGVGHFFNINEWSLSHADFVVTASSCNTCFPCRK